MNKSAEVSIVNSSHSRLTLETRYRLMVENIKDYAIYMLTPQGIIDSWNPGAEHFKGYSAQEVIGCHFSIFYTEEDRASGLPERALQFAQTDGKFENEGWRVRKDGSRFWAHVLIDPVRDEQGNFVGFAKITRDISDKKAAQDKLIETERRFRYLVQGLTDYAIYMLSPDGEVTNWNTGAERIKGYSSEDVLQTNFSRFYTAEDRAANKPEHALEIARTEGRFEAEGWRVRKDGSKFWAHVVIDAIRDENGELIGFAKITRDVTEKRQAALELEVARIALQRAQKLESIGKLTGGIAHDFNNILQVISGNLQLLQIYLSGNELTNKRLESAIGAVERGAKLSNQLLAFARRQPLQPVVINPAKVIRNVDDMLKRVLGETINVENVIAAGIWNTLVDPSQLENVLINLAINARDAMPEGGKLTIEVGNSMLDDDYVLKHDEITSGQYVMFAVTDTGTGMTPEVLEKACEPFFTTKREGEGTGLGLSMAYGFVKQSRGHFKIYSEVGHGTTIRMYFPRALEDEEQVASYLGGHVVGGTETILVVEDDLAVQETVVQTFSSLGYRVLKADDATSALGILKSGITIDLLFTDVVMPGELRSPELVKKAKALLPDIEVLFTSGYTQNAIVHGGRLDPGVHLISKPYPREQLARKIRHLLSNKKQTQIARTAKTPAVGIVPSQKPRCVLVVDDNQEACVMACEFIVALGHKAQGTSSAEQAVDLFHSGQYDILFADFNLPGMNGVELAKILKQSKPDLQIIFASGYGNSIVDSNELNAEVITKPYDLFNVLEVFKQL